MTRARDVAIAELAGGQRTIVAHEQLVLLGCSHRAIAHWVSRGRFRSVFHGVYSVIRCHPPPLAREQAGSAHARRARLPQPHDLGRDLGPCRGLLSASPRARCAASRTMNESHSASASSQPRSSSRLAISIAPRRAATARYGSRSSSTARRSDGSAERTWRRPNACAASTARSPSGWPSAQTSRSSYESSGGPSTGRAQRTQGPVELAFVA
jgi:hypothetical protein